jgi:diguanylate cyclase (GGDEF)-like protein
MRSRTNITGIPMQLTTEAQGIRNLVVNSAPILDGAGKSRGALSTFDDVTVLEQKNTQLEEMLQLLKTSQAKVNRKNEQLEILASRDPLTKCLNRRALFERMDEEFVQAQQSGQPLCCIMCDIDHFKPINDTHGHMAGDKVIRGVAEALRSLTRDNDLIGRYGGEEFCILLPATEITHAMELAERLRMKIEELDFDGIKVTTSFGIAGTEDGMHSPKELVNRADVALYRAKDSGRNCVVTWDAQIDAQQQTG